MFEAFINKLKRSAMSGEIMHLRTACLAMDLAAPGLAAEVADYILTGQPESCLGKVNHLTETSGRYPPGQLILHKTDQKYADMNKKIFHSLPNFLMSPVVRDPYVLKRLAEVIHLCAGDHKFHNMQTEMKGWFGNMLHLFDTCTNWFDVDNNLYNIPCPDRTTLMDVANLFGVSPDVVDAYILEGQPGCYRNGSTFISYLRRTTDWPKLLATPDYQNKVQAMEASAREAICYQLKNIKSTLSPQLVPIVVQLLTDRSVIVRKASAPLAALLPADDLFIYLKECYASGKADARKRWIDLAAELPSGRKLLEQWKTVENVTSVQTHIEKAMNLSTAKTNAFSLHTGPIPPYQPEVHIPSDWHTKIRVTADALIQDESEKKAVLESQLRNTPEARFKPLLENDYSWCLKRLSNYQSIGEKDIDEYLNFLQRGAVVFDHSNVANVAQKSGLFKNGEINLLVYLRQLWCLTGLDRVNSDKQLLSLITTELIDLRQLALIFRQHNQDISSFIARIMNAHGAPDKLPFDHQAVSVWQFFTDNPEYITQGLNGKLNTDGYVEEAAVIKRTLFLLSLFPEIPEEWEIGLYKHALESSADIRTTAQNTALQLGIKLSYLTLPLRSGAKNVRIVAARWLTNLKDKSAVPELYSALKQEKDLTVKAAILDALENCGEDVTQLLDRAELLADAERGLAQRLPSSLKSFPIEELPAMYFIDGSQASPDLVWWWIVLAVKLNEPEGNSLFNRYTGLLDVNSQESLGLFLISAFISTDTLTASDEECAQYALDNQQQRLDKYRDYGSKNNIDEYKNITLDTVYAELYKKKKSELVGSSIKNKGMLGLIPRLNGQSALQKILPYMSKHYRRRAQIETILLVISRFDDDSLIQLLLATAQRYRTESIQKLAISLVNALAKRRNWSPLDLADLTIPCAGLERKDAPTRFNYGARELAVILSGDLKLLLLNELGNPIKALPEAKPNDDAEDLTETKKWLSNCKKELKQIIEFQSNRLMECMISDQRWPLSDWQERLFNHPVMNQLLRRVLWQAKTGSHWTTFYINSDGRFISVSDEELLLTNASQLRVLSANQISEEECSLWKAFFRKNKVKPLFEQLHRANISTTTTQTELNHAYGYLTDSLTLSRVMEACGYKVSHFDHDKSRFYEYYKRFHPSGITAVLEFSGSYSPLIEETVAIFSITFIHRESEGPLPAPGRKLNLSDVPDNLLNAVALDYELLAQTAKPDADWQSKVL